jgi:hypothetical protein
MKHATSSRTLFSLRASGAAVAVTVLTVGLLVAVAGAAQAATAVGLGTAGSFVVLAGAGVTNTGPTTLNGDIGTFPTTSITGAGGLTVTGTVHAGDAVTQDAKTDLVTGYNVVAGQPSDVTVSADLGGGQTLTPGVYTSGSSLGLTGALTLDAGGNADAVFVFQAGSTLTTASNSSVLLVGGAQACNVFWQIGSSATLGTGSVFLGTILAMDDITVTTGVTIEGRALARNGAVTLDTNVITAPSCTSTPGTTIPATTTAQDAAAAAAAPQAPAAPQVTATPRGGVQTGDGSTVGLLGNAPHRFAFPQARKLILAAFVPTQWSPLD